MNTYSESGRCSVGNLITLAVGLSACFANIANGECDTGTSCKIPDKPRGYVRDSLSLLNAGKPRVAILDTLACIATTQRLRRGGEGALNAIMYLAENDEQIRDYLLGIFEDSKTDPLVRWEACERLVYVADVRVRQVLLQAYEQAWAVRQTATNVKASYCSGALVKLVDRAFLNSLEEAMESRQPGDPGYSTLASRALLVRIQLDMQSMLDAIASDNNPIDRGWIIRQAHRHGASRAQLRAAVQEYMRRCGYDQTRVSGSSSLKAACRRSRLFTEEEAMELGLAGAGGRSPTWKNAEVFPPWATRNHEKWAQFWRVSP